MRRITLVDGHWADLREPGKETGDLRDALTVKGRRGINVVSNRLSPQGRAAILAVQQLEPGPEQEAAVAALDYTLSEQDVETFYRTQEATMVALLVDWSLDLPLPTVATVGDLPAPIYDELALAVATEAAAATNLELDMSVGDGTPDPKGPTGGSKRSGGRSKAAKAPRSTLS